MSGRMYVSCSVQNTGQFGERDNETRGQCDNATMVVGCLPKGTRESRGREVVCPVGSARSPAAGHTIGLGLVQGKRWGWGSCRWVVTRGCSGGDDTGQEGERDPKPRPQADFPRPRGLNSTPQLNRLSLGLGLRL